MKILCWLKGSGGGLNLSGLRWLVVVCGLLWGSLAQAQTVASIVGGAEDANGQAISGIKVRISGDSLLGGAQARLTTSNGRVRFVDLLPGVYRVEASADGFQSVKVDDVRLSPGETADLTFYMEVTTSDDVFVVTREAPTLDFRKTTLGGSLSRELMRALPQADPNYLKRPDSSPVLTSVSARVLHRSMAVRTTPTPFSSMVQMLPTRRSIVSA